MREECLAQNYNISTQPAGLHCKLCKDKIVQPHTMLLCTEDVRYEDTPEFGLLLVPQELYWLKDKEFTLKFIGLCSMCLCIEITAQTI